MFPVDLPLTEQPLAWVRDKCHVRQFADNKNRPGIDYPSKITEANQKKGSSEKKEQGLQ